MITVGKQYKAFKPKEKINSKGDRIVSFSVGNSSYDKATNSWNNKGFINVIAKTNQLISDRDTVSISKISAVDTNEFDGRQSFTIFVELAGEKQDSYEAVSGNDLPF